MGGRRRVRTAHTMLKNRYSARRRIAWSARRTLPPWGSVKSEQIHSPPRSKRAMQAAHDPIKFLAVEQIENVVRADQVESLVDLQVAQVAPTELDSIHEIGHRSLDAPPRPCEHRRRDIDVDHSAGEAPFEQLHQKPAVSSADDQRPPAGQDAVEELRLACRNTATQEHPGQGVVPGAQEIEARGGPGRGITRHEDVPRGERPSARTPDLRRTCIARSGRTRSRSRSSLRAARRARAGR